MAYIVSLKHSAEKELERFPAKIQDRIIEHLISLTEEPRPSGVKKLRGREGYKIRVGNYRILYVIDNAEEKVEVFSIAHRKDAYRFSIVL